MCTVTGHFAIPTTVCEDRMMMLPLSRAVAHAGDIAPALFTGAKLESLIMRAGLSEFQPPPSHGAQRYGKAQLVASTLYGATMAAAEGDSDADEGLKQFIRLVAVKASADDFTRLSELVRSAGYDLRLAGEDVRLLPLDEPASPLSHAITALEADFNRLGMSVAKNHYSQAVDCLADARPEAANSQLRSMLEDVIIYIAESNGFSRSKQGDGGRALKHLIDDRSILPASDGGNYIRGLWQITHTNGSHPGTSPVGEAHFRLQAITSAARYLIDRFMLL